MCFPPGARPPEIPADLLPISGSAGGEDVIVTSADGATYRSYLVKAGGDAGVVIAPDVRGLHSFYEALAERFASAGVHAIGCDYFGRTAGTDRRPDDWASFQEHASAARARPDLLQADLAAAAAALRSRTGATRIFVLGFCMGGRAAFNASAGLAGLTGAIGFYGVVHRRGDSDTDSPIENVPRMKAPILGLFGGADAAIPADRLAEFDKALDERKVPHHLEIYPGAPHSFFDRQFAQYQKECDDAWRRALGFIATGDPKAVR